MNEIYSTPTHTPETLKVKPVKAPFGYYGAKLRIARKIVDALPPHNAWVEGFCGSAALTLAKRPAPIEVINDADGQIVNLFEQLRNNAEALCRVVALTPYARAEFEVARRTQEESDPLERARLFLVGTMMTVNATIGGTNSGFSFSESYAREAREARVNRWYNLPARLEKVVERLRGVRIENRDASELLKMFANRPATLVYLDPPYFVKRDHAYVIDANDHGFHENLLAICKKVKCMLLISGYENDLYEDLLRPEDGWSKSMIETHTRDTSGRDYARTEVLWMNAQFSKAQSTQKVPIRLTKKEKMENKINPCRGR
jgi:DNA adenine methylase